MFILPTKLFDDLNRNLNEFKKIIHEFLTKTKKL